MGFHPGVMGLSPMKKQVPHRKTKKWWKELDFRIPWNWLLVLALPLWCYWVLGKPVNHWRCLCSPLQHGITHVLGGCCD